MSDDDFNENEEFDFEYSGSDQEEAHVDLENQYYEAKGWDEYSFLCVWFLVHHNTILKGHKQDDPARAIKEFLAVVEAEEEKGEWYGHMIRISYRIPLICHF